MLMVKDCHQEKVVTAEGHSHLGAQAVAQSQAVLDR